MPSKPRTFLASSDGINRLNAAKTRLNLTSAAIAKLAGVSADTVGRLLRGKRVSEASVRTIATVLNLQLNEIMSVEPGQGDEALAKAEQRIQYALLTKAIVLNLSGLNLTTVPESLGNLSNLIKLNLSQNQLTTVPENLGNLSNLIKLNLSQNQLTMVPESLGNLSNLTELSLYGNRLMRVPESVGNLSNLTELNLSQNQLTAVPESLGNLSNLSLLYLHYNQLTTVPESLGNLSNLTELSLYGNQLTLIPESLGNLSNLTKLYLSQNQLTTVPESLGNLSNLTELYLYQNQLTAVPESLGNLNNLTVLSLDQNQLTTVPEFISQLTKLQRIDLNDNQLIALPEFLEQLPNLQALLLHGNEQLGISNEILGPTFISLDGGNSLANPQDILNYYFRVLGADDRQPLNEAKLILVGFGNVGKTSLVNRLVHHTFDPDSKKTEGIQITQWPIRLHHKEEIKLHVWDFGGQEIMHSTHQFFLTERSLYVLVLNGRQGHEEADSEYWLELIQSFGGDSPVIVVLNKVNEHPFDVNRSALKQKFPAICEFIATDCADNRGFEQLQDAIERETDRLEHLRDAFPTSWVTLKNRLADMADNYISFDKYREICQQDGELDHGAQNSLAVHLHSLGIALNYKNDPRLRDTHVLNPHWVTSGIYKLLNAPDLAAAKGELAIASLADILDCQIYPPERHGFLLELMRKFELCFPFPEDEHRYLIPDLLDKQQPPGAEDFNPDECLNFRYEYPILPEGLLPRFIVRTHVLSTQQHRWRTGVILEFEGNRALVKGDRQDRSVTISVNGPVTSRRRLLAIIRHDCDRIHSSFKFKPLEKVPVPQHPQVSVDYKELVTREEHRQTTFDVFTGDGLLTLNVRDLLNGVDLDVRRKPVSVSDRHHRPLQLFYSYSHRDESLRDELEIRLKLLERNGLIQSWHDRRITPGIEWQQELDQQLEQADIILLLVSPDFIASDYCYEIEMTRALQRHAAGEAIVIPILLRSGVDWASSSFSHLQALPTDLKPVTKWSDSDDAWHNVEQGIKHVIQGRKTR